jgi:uncharacterized membrane protein (DUF485 family)
MVRQLILLAGAFLVGVLAALALGAVNLGTALGVGQLTFAAMLVYLLLSSRSDRSPDDGV